MNKTIFKYLEATAQKYPDKIAFADAKREITFADFVRESKNIGTVLARKGFTKRPVAVFLEKSVAALTCMMGVNYSGNFYTVVDNKMPADRIENILHTLEPVVILTDSKNREKIADLAGDAEIMLVDEVSDEYDQALLDDVYARIIDTDIMYVLFTSGSTGTPKGTILNHRAVISYIHWFTETFKIDRKTVFGSQTPFYFSMSVSDVFATMVAGATFYIIPKMYFSFPVKLIEFLNEKKINTIYWVPSALCIVANFKTLDVVKPKYLKKILFAGEQMPMKQLNMWRKKLPRAMYANLFGPTETVDICAYYVVDREFKDDEILPIGRACDNCGLLVVDEENHLVTEVGAEGELCARGSFLCSGYYKNPEKTAEVLVQNPLNNIYPELVYKTGDIVKLNARGEYEHVTRKDFQIKHMGYRIELGEIESSISAIAEVDTSICIYDADSSKIVLFYLSGSLDELEVLELVKKKVPKYMVPQEVIKLASVPYNANGKIDRKKLGKDYKEGVFAK